MQHWSAGFVGLPWAERGRDRHGVDCYGLLVLVYRQVNQIDLPTYGQAYTSVDERAEIAALLEVGAEQWPWQPIAIEDVRDLDVLLFRRGRLESHVGIVAGRGAMLHVERDALSCIERFEAGRWRPRLTGAFRHALAS